MKINVTWCILRHVFTWRLGRLHDTLVEFRLGRIRLLAFFFLKVASRANDKEYSTDGSTL